MAKISKQMKEMQQQHQWFNTMTDQIQHEGNLDTSQQTVLTNLKKQKLLLKDKLAKHNGEKYGKKI